MTTKNAATIVNTMKPGLTGVELDAAIDLALLAKAEILPGQPTYEKAFAAVRNEYVQHSWDAEDDLTGPMPKATVSKTKKVTKKAEPKAKKAAKTPKAKAEKAPKGPSRVQRMFEHVLAGLSNEDAVTAIQKEFGKDVPTNVSSIGWCRSQLKAGSDYAKKYNPKGRAVLTNREAIDKTAKK